MSAKTKTLTSQDVTLPDSSGWRKVPAIAGLVGVIGIAVALTVGGDGGAYAYLWAYMYWLSIGIGAMFFVLFQHITRAGWSVTVRRVAEKMMVTLPVFAVLFVPILLKMNTLYTWTQPDMWADDPIAMNLLDAKDGYLNVGFFLARAAVFFVVWTLVAVYFYKRSTAQDASGDHEISRKLQGIAAPAIIGAALSTTFAAFDWNMSLDWHWFSTIFGVIYFAGSMVGALAMMAILLTTLNNAGALKGSVTTEHMHDVGKLMWGFMVFWAYTSFSQFILIWYANIPEETLWYHHRWEGSWKYVSIALAAGHFWVPFFAFMSRHMKRNPNTLRLFAGYMLFIHAVDLYWQIMPNRDHGGASFGLADAAAFVGVGGVFMAVLAVLLTRGPLVPVKDPRLSESLAFENY